MFHDPSLSNLHNVRCSMRVIYKRKANDPNVIGGHPTRSLPFLRKLKIYLAHTIVRLLANKQSGLHTIAWPDSGLLHDIQTWANNVPNPVIQINWLGNETLSIHEISKITHPVTWRLADQWAFSGSSHYTLPSVKPSGFQTGYKLFSPAFSLIDWITWQRKKFWFSKSHRTPTLLCPSSWIALSAKSSRLMSNYPSVVLPTPLDTGFWKPVDSSEIVQRYQLPPDKRFILFGADGGDSDPRKGSNYLYRSLNLLQAHNASSLSDVVLLTYGSSFNQPVPLSTSLNHINLGRIDDDHFLRQLYSLAYVLVLPSVIENLSGIGIEAMCCGLPIVAFNRGGNPDLVKSGVSGFLADSVSATSLADVLLTVITLSPSNHSGLRASTRSHAIQNFSRANLITKYADFYKSLTLH